MHRADLRVGKVWEQIDKAVELCLHCWPQGKRAKGKLARCAIARVHGVHKLGNIKLCVVEAHLCTPFAAAKHLGDVHKTS